MAQNAPDRFSAAHGQPEPTPHHKVNYYGIFALLVGLTVVTVAVAFVHLESELMKVLVALTIASIKATFVAMYFMHLKFEGKLLFMILMIPIGLTLILVCALIPDIIMPAVNNLMLGRPY